MLSPPASTTILPLLRKQVPSRLLAAVTSSESAATNTTTYHAEASLMSKANVKRGTRFIHLIRLDDDVNERSPSLKFKAKRVSIPIYHQIFSRQELHEEFEQWKDGVQQQLSRPPSSTLNNHHHQQQV